MDTLFSNVTIVTMDEAMHVYFDAYLGVTDGKISYLAREAPKEKTKRLVPGEGMVLMPGLINCHTHLPMTILRGYADDYDLKTWLEDYIFPREDRLDDRAVKAGALLGISRAGAQKLIECGAVRVNGRPAPKNRRLEPGDVVEADPPAPEPIEAQPQDIPLDVVYEDGELLVVNKPQGMVVHPAPGNPDGTLVTTNGVTIGGAQQKMMSGLR